MCKLNLIKVSQNMSDDSTHNSHFGLIEEQSHSLDLNEQYPPIDINDRQSNMNKSFRSNFLTTAKYTWWNFIPKNILEQFRRMTNIYYLFIVILSLIPSVSAFSPLTSIVPLLFVLAVSAIKEGYEDIKRHKADKIVNSTEYRVLVDGEFILVKSSELKVGDIVLLTSGEDVPADALLLKTSNESQNCFIQTANLDGETNLKIISSFEESSKLSVKKIKKLSGVIEAESPDRLLHVFNGNITLKNSITKPIGIDNLLLRGVRVENTDEAYAVILYCGKDTKLSLNLIAPPFKFSRTEVRMNSIVLAIFFSKLFLCSMMTLLFILFATGSGSYLEDGDPVWLNSLESFLIYFSLLSYFIPISLCVTLEIVKLGQAIFMHWDKAFIVEESFGPTNTINVNNSNLNDELGRVSFLFSDKTGTLTQNKMVFSKASIGGVRYRDGNRLHEDLDSENGKNVEKFLLNMMLNNVVVPQPGEDDSMKYQGPSPDEIALCLGSQENQFVLNNRLIDSVECTVLGEKRRYEILQILDFTSSRKRMTVFVRDEDDVIRAYIKGSDDVILERILQDNPKLIKTTKKHIDKFSEEGLRTLLLGEKILSEDEFLDFNANFLAASSIINREKREEQKEKVMESIETDFHLVGCSAVEDKLQDYVPETIQNLLQAGIKVWIITGDKQETATNIAHSCKLIRKHALVLTITGEKRKEVKKEIALAQKEFNRTDLPVSLVIRGKSLVWALSAYSEEFKKLSMGCDSVVCCRTSPLQKAEVVRLIKHSTEDITLAIGDGANDAAMLSEAHIGVGIYGKEGSQAARQSDYAIHQFSHLQRLLFIHGRYSMLRSTKLIYYGFYKNVSFFLVQFWFAFFNGYSGQTFYEDFILLVYNVVIVGLPPFIFGLLEKDLAEEDLKKSSHLYREIKEIYMDWGSFAVWMLIAIYHSIIFFFIPYFLWNSNDVQWSNMRNGEYWIFSTGVALPAVMTVLLICYLYSNHTTAISHIILGLSLFAFVLQVLIESVILSLFPDMYHVLCFISFYH
eukprot:TRINITY_DN5407_c0_g1_i1.p1 TRINITY_DN5407_c0_g1~~TRINITY_DN5407_c0_g1_i1.p1  ORF type:complete len:1031 (-),score=195.89 TRINITY_DN5407_c0_g1_i1:231-3302(-)